MTALNMERECKKKNITLIDFPTIYKIIIVEYFVFHFVYQMNIHNEKSIKFLSGKIIFKYFL